MNSQDPKADGEMKIIFEDNVFENFYMQGAMLNFEFNDAKSLSVKNNVFKNIKIETQEPLFTLSTFNSYSPISDLRFENIEASQLVKAQGKHLEFKNLSLKNYSPNGATGKAVFEIQLTPLT